MPSKSNHKSQEIFLKDTGLHSHTEWYFLDSTVTQSVYYTLCVTVESSAFEKRNISTVFTCM